MEMTFRWFGKDYDAITLNQIKQIPGVKGVITTLYYKQPGELWTEEEIKKLKDEVEKEGLYIAGIESVNIHDHIKTGASDRDIYIDNYIKTLENLGKQNIKLVCYNFMPVFDWTRSDLKKPLEDGSTVLSYNQELIDKIDPDNIFNSLNKDSNGFVLPGWEPERMAKIKDLFEQYKDITEDKLRDNLKYFLQRIMPTCEKYQIKMAIHPDDPSWSVFNLPRIVKNKEDILKLFNLVDSKYNGLTFCSGSLGSNPDNDLVDIINTCADRIHFAHIRNIKYLGYRKFEEAAHLSKEGSLDLYKLLKALYDNNFDGPIRPDHGRNVWDEVSMPGYGLYDRAMGACYLQGLWEAIDKDHKNA